MPWALLSLIVFAWGLPGTKARFNARSARAGRAPALHRAVLRAPPVVSAPRAEDAVFVSTGSRHRHRALLTASWPGCCSAGGRRLLASSRARACACATSLVTIAACSRSGSSRATAGLDATMGLAFASTGWLFPFFSPMLGWLGVALTGSDTSSNVLFGNLQQITAEQVGVSPVLAAASNSSGGVMGKMIDAQSIVVAGRADGAEGRRGEILRYVFFHSLALAVLVGVPRDAAGLRGAGHRAVRPRGASLDGRRAPPVRLLSDMSRSVGRSPTRLPHEGPQHGSLHGTTARPRVVRAAGACGCGLGLRRWWRRPAARPRRTVQLTVSPTTSTIQVGQSRSSRPRCGDRHRVERVTWSLSNPAWGRHGNGNSLTVVGASAAARRRRHLAVRRHQARGRVAHRVGVVQGSPSRPRAERRRAAARCGSRPT
jgi:hypothetical protein